MDVGAAIEANSLFDIYHLNVVVFKNGDLEDKEVYTSHNNTQLNFIQIPVNKGDKVVSQVIYSKQKNCPYESCQNLYRLILTGSGRTFTEFDVTGPHLIENLK